MLFTATLRLRGKHLLPQRRKVAKEDIRLLRHLDAFPECDPAFDFLGLWFCVRVVPRRVGVGFAVDYNIVIAGCALPSADGVGFAWLKEFGFDRILRKIMIAFDDDRFVAVGEYCSRSEEHTSELQSQSNLVCRLLLEKK